MIQRQITNHKSNNLLVLVGCTRVLPEIILKFRHLKYRRSEENKFTNFDFADLILT